MDENMSTEYANFLKRAKKDYKKVNFFSYEIIKQFKKALETELTYKKNQKGDYNASGSKVEKGLKKWYDKAKSKAESLQGDNNVTYNELVNKRKGVDKSEATSFMTFANESLKSIKVYLDEIDSKEYSGSEFLNCCEKLKNYLILNLKNYRKDSSKYHVLGKSKGRAEIANVVMGGSLQYWINKSYDLLRTLGTSFKICEGKTYEFRKLTDEEFKQTGVNKFEKIVVKNSFGIPEIKNK